MMEGAMEIVFWMIIAIVVLAISRTDELVGAVFFNCLSGNARKGGGLEIAEGLAGNAAGADNARR